MSVSLDMSRAAFEAELARVERRIENALIDDAVRRAVAPLQATLARVNATLGNALDVIVTMQRTLGVMPHSDHPDVATRLNHIESRLP